MKLFYSPIGGFIHKVIVTAHEAGLADRLERVAVWPLREGHDISALNPLNKVPTLALDDGTVLYGSEVISEFFDSHNKTAPLFPPAGPARWDAIRRRSLADQAFEVTVQVILAKAPEGQAVYDWGWPKIMRALDRMEQDAKKGFAGFDVGHASTLQMISYFNRTNDQSAYTGFGRTERYDWREGRPALAAWYDEAIKRPSVTWLFGKDYEGEVSPEAIQKAVAGVLAQTKAEGRA